MNAATRRLYHEDPELRSFDARVLLCRPAGDAFEVVLDRTGFYPTGGGQPHDLGLLDGAAVRDVREEEERVVHVVERAPSGAEVRGEVDWGRRTDHRQQHSGQHVLSRAVQDVLGAATVGFHLGTDRCTIDLDRDGPDEAGFERAEDAANAIVLRDVPIAVEWLESPADLPPDIRKEFEGPGPVRLVRMGEFDVNPCCGTHCARTGEIGPIKILRWERNKAGLRVEFVCGGRALEDHRRRHRALRSMALALTTDEFDVENRVASLRADAKALRSRVEKLEKELQGALVASALAASRPGEPVFRDVGPDRASWLAPVAGALAGEGRRALLVSTEGSELRLAVALPEGEHAGNRLREALAGLPGRGGGAERLAQGKIEARALDAVIQKLGFGGCIGTIAGPGE